MLLIIFISVSYVVPLYVLLFLRYFNYLSAINVTRVSFSPIFQYFVTYVHVRMPCAAELYKFVGHGFFDLEFVRHGFVSHRCRCCCTCR